MNHLSVEMQKCIDECLRCHGICLAEAMNHCLEAGGKHVAPEHFRLMMACAEICRTAASLMLIGTGHHTRTCAACAEICADCARSCDRVGDMDECVRACMRCAESCRRIAN
jgi:hypothetical protein